MLYFVSARNYGDSLKFVGTNNNWVYHITRDVHLHPESTRYLLELKEFDSFKDASKYINSSWFADKLSAKIMSEDEVGIYCLLEE